jgi:hypothetical protein
VLLLLAALIARGSSDVQTVTANPMPAETLQDTKEETSGWPHATPKKRTR